VARLGRKKQELSEEERLEMLRRYSQDGSPEVYFEELPMAPAEQTTIGTVRSTSAPALATTSTSPSWRGRGIASGAFERLSSDEGF
jgi:hypothetical protein